LRKLVINQNEHDIKDLPVKEKNKKRRELASKMGHSQAVQQQAYIVDNYVPNDPVDGKKEITTLEIGNLTFEIDSSLKYKIIIKALSIDNINRITITPQ
jgi:hypothetical protein